uniref:Uncharacterized protein n=1 Tax=Gouania willdenowi TaxID=441366 RepID=A0A8C5DPI2_GOUWI
IEQLGGSELTNPNHKKLSLLLQKIGEEWDENAELQRMIDDPNLTPTFLKVLGALFYFACRLIIKEQGGWEGIRSYLGTPTWLTLCVFLAGVLAAAAVILKM